MRTISSVLRALDLRPLLRATKSGCRFGPPLALSVLLAAPVFATDEGVNINAEDDGRPTDPDCGNGAAATGVGKPVSPFSGKEFFEHTDMELPGVYPIEIVRRYDSQTTYQSPLGYGWAFTHDWRLYEYGDGTVVVRSACGIRHRYVPTGNDLVTEDTPGFRFDLKSVPGGGYVLSDRPGTLRFFDAEGRLTAIQNPQGNRHEFSYDSRGLLPLVGRSSQAADRFLGEPQVLAYTYRLTRIAERTADGALTGRFVDLSYDDASGRLLSIQANDGRRVSYQHEMADAGGTQLTTGNLTKVIGLEGIEQTFRYDTLQGRHLVTAMQLGQGMEPVLNVYDELGRVTQQIDGDSTLTFIYQPSPNKFDFAEDAADCDVLQCRIVKRTIVTPDQPDRVATTAYKYRSDGYLIETIDALGHRRAVSYDPARPYENREQLFENRGSPAAPNRVLQKTISRSHDIDGNLTQVQVILDDGEVVTEQWTYEGGWIASRQVASSTQPTKVFRTEWTFERAGFAPDEPGFSSASPISNLHSMRRRRDDGTYDEAVFSYNGNGQLTRVIPPEVSPPEGLQIVLEYATGIDDPVGMLEEEHLETFGVRLLTLSRRFSYDVRSFLESEVDALGAVTVYEHDDLNRITKKTEQIDLPTSSAASRFETAIYTYRGPTVGVTEIEAAPPGIFLSEIERGRTVQDGSGHGIRLLHDDRGRLVEISRKGTGGFSSIERRDYDSDGNVLGARDALGRGVTFDYDLLGRIVSLEDAAGNQTRFAYDAAGNRVQSVDAKNRSVRSIFDDLDRPRVVWQEAESVVTRFAYDAAGNLISIEDGKQQKTAYEYDSRSRLISITQALGLATSSIGDFALRYGFDDRDRLVRVENSRHQIQDYFHAVWSSVAPAGGVLRVEHYPSVSDADQKRNLERTISYTYDLQASMRSTSDSDRLTAVPAGSDPLVEPAGRLYTFTYDAVQRLENSTAHYVPGGSPGQGRMLRSGYDRFKNRVLLDLSGPAERSTYTWSFDAKDRMIGVCMPQSQPCGASDGTVQLDYLDNDDVEAIRHGDGSTTRYTYKPYGLVDSITVNGSGTSEPLKLVYSYDETLNVDAIREFVNGSELVDAGGGTPARDHIYDGVDRLVGARYPAGVGLPGRETFDYDLAGNRDDASLAGAPLGTYTYDANNRIVTSPNRSYEFDADGNLVGRTANGSPSARLIFDHQNRLRRYEALPSSDSISYFYDPFGRRIRKEVNGVTTWYVWDGDALLAEYDASGVRTVRYGYAGRVIAEEVAHPSTGGNERIHTVHADHLGTPRLLTTGGAEAWRANYRAHGSAAVESDPDGDGQRSPDFNLRFPGQYFDAETNLNYNRFRYYDPETGRYVSADPIGQADGANIYLYAGGDPANNADPLGLYFGTDDAAFAVGGAIVGAAGQLLGDALSGTETSTEDLAAAAAGGAAGGVALLYTGPIGAGAIGGFTTNFLKQLRRCGFDPCSLIADSAIGAATGLVPGLRAPIVTVGRNSFNAIYKTIVTKAKNGTIKNISTSTAVKMVIGRAVGTGLIPGTGAGAVAALGAGRILGKLNCRR